MGSVHLHFEANLAYQQRAVESVCRLFEGVPAADGTFSVTLPVAGEAEAPSLGMTVTGRRNELPLTDEMLLENLRAVQEQNGIEQDVSLSPAGWNFTIEMETGTGKTYVFLRTIYELNKRYGLTKFVIVVPSIAIKEGVFKSMEIMDEHLRTMYDGVVAERFLYDSDRLHEVKNFGNSDKIQIMVCTIQSITDISRDSDFADAPRRRSGRRAHRIMYSVHEQMGDLMPIEYIRRCRPIVIVDEPQNIGAKGEENGIACLQPLCTLRYSATHRNLFHPIYCLNAVDASLQHLVKEIEVVGISSDLTHIEPYVRLLDTSSKKGGSAKLEILRKTSVGDYIPATCTVTPGTLLGMVADCPGVYDDIVVQEVREDYIVLSHCEAPLYKGQAIGGVDEMQQARTMIRATIEEHLRKEVRLRGKGIKVLSLFFIDRVEDYRRYDQNRCPEPGRLAALFEEEYTRMAQRAEYRSLFADGVPAAASVHNGYFSIDKGRRGQREIWTDTEDNARGKEAAARAYELIMRDKERLLSVDEPLKFIFSHTMLKEGWDNPNVFQVCVLRDMHSTVSRRQALGRGLRICVNQRGERVREAGVNILTVVAKENFRSFAESLQKEYEEGGVRFGVVTKARLGALAYENANGDRCVLGQAEAERVMGELFARGLLLPGGEPTESLKTALENGTCPVEAASPEAREAILAHLAVLTRPLQIHDARERCEVHSRYGSMKDTPAFSELWQRLCRRTCYSVGFDSDSLVEQVARHLDAELSRITAPLVTRMRTRVVTDASGVHAGTQHTETLAMDTRHVPVGDILTSLEATTHLTRRTLSRILSRARCLPAIRLNGPLFEKIAQKVIRAAVHRLMVETVSYRPADIGPEVWSAEALFRDTTAYADRLVPGGEKCLTDAVSPDSHIEAQFARDAACHDMVKLYAKLPAGFVIPTPLGDYNPDWALVLETPDGARFFYVVETKSVDMLSSDMLRDKEVGKMKCAEKHFALLQAGQENGIRYLAAVSSLEKVVAHALSHPVA